MTIKQLFLIFMLCFISSFSLAQDEEVQNITIIEPAGDVAHGEQLFKANCASCHKPDRVLIGPALKGVRDKYENDMDYITKFVQNSQQVIESGDERAVTVFEDFNKQVMTNFPTLTSNDVSDILAYADSFEKAETDGIKIRPLPPKPASSLKPLYISKNIGVWLFYSFTIILLISALYLLVVMADLFKKRKKTKSQS